MLGIHQAKRNEMTHNFFLVQAQTKSDVLYFNCLNNWTIKQSDKACHDEDKNDFIMHFIKIMEWKTFFSLNYIVIFLNQSEAWIQTKLSN